MTAKLEGMDGGFKFTLNGKDYEFSRERIRQFRFMRMKYDKEEAEAHLRLGDLDPYSSYLEETRYSRASELKSYKLPPIEMSVNHVIHYIPGIREYTDLSMGDILSCPWAELDEVAGYMETISDRLPDVTFTLTFYQDRGDEGLIPHHRWKFFGGEMTSAKDLPS